MGAVVLAYEPADATANGTETHACAGCGAEIPTHKKWCSEGCRNRHRQRDNPTATSPSETDNASLPVSESVETAETWTFGAVARELVDYGLVVNVNIEGIQLRCSRHQP